MKHPSLTERKGVGWAMSSLAAALIGALLSVSPTTASASSASSDCVLSAFAMTFVSSNVSVPECAHSGHEAVREVYRREAQSVMATANAEIKRQRASIESALDQIQASATRIAQQSPQETDTKNSVALWRLKDEAKSLKAQIPRQARALSDQWDAAIKGAMAQALYALEETESQHSESDSQRTKHGKEVKRTLNKQRKETLSFLDDMWKDNASQNRTRIAQAIESLDKAIALEQAEERGPVVGYRYVHHRGHVHRELIYQNEQRKP